MQGESRRQVYLDYAKPQPVICNYGASRSRRQGCLDYAEPPPVICNETARRKALISNFLQGGILFFDNFRQRILDGTCLAQRLLAVDGVEHLLGLH